jgi:hypothetical protein
MVAVFTVGVVVVDIEIVLTLQDCRVGLGFKEACRHSAVLLVRYPRKDNNQASFKEGVY